MRAPATINQFTEMLVRSNETPIMNEMKHWELLDGGLFPPVFMPALFFKKRRRHDFIHNSFYTVCAPTLHPWVCDFKTENFSFSFKPQTKRCLSLFTQKAFKHSFWLSHCWRLCWWVAKKPPKWPGSRALRCENRPLCARVSMETTHSAVGYFTEHLYQWTKQETGQDGTAKVAM